MLYTYIICIRLSDIRYIKYANISFNSVLLFLYIKLNLIDLIIKLLGKNMLQRRYRLNITLSDI